jgi:hypothetical protein
MRLFSYVVQHDLGHAPNPSHGYCTLAHCKFKPKRKNIVELAKEGDWVIGTGGADLRVSAGHGRLIYAMKIKEVITLNEYFSDKRFSKKKIQSGVNPLPDNLERHRYNSERVVLIANEFYYFGRDAIKLPRRFLNRPIEKRGPGFKYRSFDECFVHDFEKWIRTKKPGVNGIPCGSQRSARPKRC